MGSENSRGIHCPQGKNPKQVHLQEAERAGGKV